MLQKLSAVRETLSKIDHPFEELLFIHSLRNEISAAEQYLQENGNSIPYHVLNDDCTDSIRVKGRELKKEVRRIAEETGRKPFLIGHSRGGMVVLDCLLFWEGDKYIDHAIILGTPYMGTLPDQLEPLLPFYNYDMKKYVWLNDLFPDSKYIRELISAKPPKTKVYSYSGDKDWIVSAESSYIPWAENILLQDTGHLHYIIHSEVKKKAREIHEETGSDPYYVHGLHRLVSGIIEKGLEWPCLSFIKRAETNLADNGFKIIHAGMNGRHKTRI